MRQISRLLTLGLAISFKAGRGSRVRMALMMIGAIAASFLVLAVSSLSPAMQRIDKRVQQLETRPGPGVTMTPSGGEIGEDTGLYQRPVYDEWQGQGFTRTYIASRRDNDERRPAGIPQLPKPGEMYLSPALADLVKQNPELGRRFHAKQVGVIQDEGLLSPSELRSYIGIDPAHIDADLMIGGWGPDRFVINDTGLKEVGMLLTVILGLLVLLPVGVYFLTCSRLSSSIRAHRLEALRTLGLSRWETQLVNLTEVGLVAFTGSAIGLTLWTLYLSTRKEVSLGVTKMFSTDLALPVMRMISVVVIVTLLPVVASYVATRRAATGKRTRQRSWRIFPNVLRIGFLGAGVVLLSMTTDDAEKGNFVTPFLLGTALSFAGVLLLLAPIASVLSRALLQRKSSGMALLTGRRLPVDTPSLTRIVAGVMMAVYLATLALGFVHSIEAENERITTGAIGGERNLSTPGAVFIDSNKDLEDVLQRRFTGVVTLPVYEHTVKLEKPTPFGETTSKEYELAATCRQLEYLVRKNIPCVEGTRYAFGPKMTEGSIEGIVRYSDSYQASDEERLEIPPSGKASYFEYPAEYLVPPGKAKGKLAATITDLARRSYDEDVVRNVVSAVDPLAGIEGLPGKSTDDDKFFGTVVSAVRFGMGFFFLLCFLSMIIATADRALERRREMVRLTSIGVPVGVLRRAQLLSSVGPSLVVLLVTAGVSRYAAIVLADAQNAPGLPWTDTLIAIGVGVVCLAFAAVAGLVALSPTIRPELLRDE